MPSQKVPGESGGLNINELQETAMNVVETLCGILCRPVELVLRPWHGTRYFQVPVIFFSSLLMILLPAFSAVATGVVSMIPFSHAQPPIGLFDIGSLAKLYFLLSFVHGIRIYRRMIHMELEENSEYEGPALPFFYLIPGSSSFWRLRILIEPLALLIAAGILGHIFIFQTGLVTYLQTAALALAMKSFIGWYRAWEYIRNLMDMRFAGPIIARMADNQASEEDLATIHLVSLPKHLAPDIRHAAISHLAREFSSEISNSSSTAAH